MEGAWPRSQGKGLWVLVIIPIWPGSGDAKDSDCEDMAVVERKLDGTQEGVRDS